MTRFELIGSWPELAALGMTFRKQQSMLFRGQGCNATPLPKIGRENTRRDAYGSYRGYSPEAEKKLIGDFKRIAAPLVRWEPKTEIEWLSIAQHHGLPTRLLDWTSNLFAAAFFATKHMGNDEAHGWIFAIDASEFPESADDPCAAPQGVYIHRPRHLSERISSQGGFFTVHNPPTQAIDIARLRAWRIDSSLCGPIKDALRAVGIHHASLFPGLDGAAEHLSWMYKWHFDDPNLDR